MAAYFLVNIETNIVENVIEWDGDTSKWQSPATHFLLQADTTPAADWQWDEAAGDYVEVESTGNGGIGDTWNGTRLIEPKPETAPASE